MPRDRLLAFFHTYLAVIVGIATALTGVLVAAPSILAVLLESPQAQKLAFVLFLIAPAALLWSSAVATLQGLTELTTAQLVARASTVAMSLVFAAVYLLNLDFFRRHPDRVVVPTCLLVLTLGGVAAYLRIRSQARPSGPMWFLPEGFWRFASQVQISSVLTLLQRRLDQIVLLKLAGIETLGVYYVLLQTAHIVDVITGWILDGVFAVFSRFNAQGDIEGIRRLYAIAGRYIVLIALVGAAFTISFAPEILAFFGPAYAGHEWSFVLLVAFSAIDVLGPLNHTLLVGSRRVNAWISVQSLHSVVFLATAWSAAPQFGIKEATLVRLVAAGVASAFAYWLVVRTGHVRVTIPREYPFSVLIVLGLAAFAAHRPDGLGWMGGAGAFVIAVSLFLALSGYRLGEIRRLRQKLRAA